MPAAEQKRELMINSILGRGQFIANERPQIVRNLLSTDVLVYPADVNNRERLNEKISDAIEYAANITDIERLNALYYVPKNVPEKASESSEHLYLALGLYQYFADECSRKNPATTFLTSMREVDARLPKGKDFEHEDLYEKLQQALSKAGIATEANLKILQEWHETGHYTIQGRWHGRDLQSGEMTGAYARLEEKLTRRFHDQHRQGKMVGIDEAISYAVGNKLDMEGFKGDENDTKAYEHVEQTIEDNQAIADHVSRGYMIRHRRIQHIVYGDDESPPLFTREALESSKRRQKEAQPFLRKILSYFPDDALELLLRDHQTFAYSDSTNIEAVFPLGAVPGSDDALSDRTRRSIGGRHYRYRTGFFSNGEHTERIDDPQLKEMRLAQTCLHETMHIACEYMTKDELAELKQLAVRVSQAVRGPDAESKMLLRNDVFPYPVLSEKLQVHEDRSLAEELDCKASLYDGYRETVDADNPKKIVAEDTRWEEVLCNTYGLMHTEFRDHEQAIFSPPQGLEVICEFAQKADECMHNALERLRTQQEAQNIQLPLSSGMAAARG